MRLTLLVLLGFCGLAEAAGQVEVVVLTASGEPAYGARILVLDSTDVRLSGGKDSLVLSQAIANKQGGALISAPWGGRICFLAFRGSQAAFACDLEVTPGKPLEARLGPAVILAGRILGDTGEPLDGARVRALIASGYEMHGVDAMMKKGGVFRLPAIPVEMFKRGFAELEVERDGYMPVSLPLRLGSGRAPIEVTMAKPRSLSGRVVTADGKPVAGARVVTVAPGDPKDPALYDDDLGIRTTGDGRFSLDAMAKRSLYVYVVSHAYAHRLIEIEAGAEPLDLGDLTVEVGGTVRGTVREPDDRIITYGFASLEDKHGFRVRSAPLAPGGKFEFPHVGSGAHQLEIWIHGTKGLGGSAHLYRQDVRVGGDPLDLVVPAGLRIRFVDAAGEPVTVFACTIQSPQWSQNWPVGDSVPDGMSAFRIHPHGPCEMRISVKAMGFEPVTGILATVDAKGKGEVEVVLVRDPDAPLARAPSERGIPAPIKPKTGALKQISLPENPTKEQVRAYLQKIKEVVGDRSSFSSTDPEVGMIMEVGPDHVDVLIERLRNPRVQTPYLEWALANLITEDHKNLILENLESCRDLVEFVVEKGWAPDARETLIEVLAEKPTHVPTEWIDAVASFQDPETYPLLTGYLSRGGNPGWTYRSIRELPGIELESAVAEAWSRCGRSPWNRQSCAGVAADFGHLDALACASSPSLCPTTITSGSGMRRPSSVVSSPGPKPMTRSPPGSKRTRTTSCSIRRRRPIG